MKNAVCHFWRCWRIDIDYLALHVYFTGQYYWSLLDQWWAVCKRCRQYPCRYICRVFCSCFYRRRETSEQGRQIFVGGMDSVFNIYTFVTFAFFASWITDIFFNNLEVAVWNKIFLKHNFHFLKQIYYLHYPVQSIAFTIRKLKHIEVFTAVGHHINNRQAKFSRLRNKI